MSIAVIAGGLSVGLGFGLRDDGDARLVIIVAPATRRHSARDLLRALRCMSPRLDLRGAVSRSPRPLSVNDHRPPLSIPLQTAGTTCHRIKI